MKNMAGHQKYFSISKRYLMLYWCLFWIIPSVITAAFFGQIYKTNEVKLISNYENQTLIELNMAKSRIDSELKTIVSDLSYLAHYIELEKTLKGQGSESIQENFLVFSQKKKDI